MWSRWTVIWICSLQLHLKYWMADSVKFNWSTRILISLSNVANSIWIKESACTITSQVGRSELISQFVGLCLLRIQLSPTMTSLLSTFDFLVLIIVFVSISITRHILKSRIPLIFPQHRHVSWRLEKSVLAQLYSESNRPCNLGYCFPLPNMGSHHSTRFVSPNWLLFCWYRNKKAPVQFWVQTDFSTKTCTLGIPSHILQSEMI